MASMRTTRDTGQRETGQSSRPSQNSSNGPNGGLGRTASQGTPLILTEHCDALDRLAHALLQEAVLERNQVLAIVKGAQNIPSGAR